LKYTSPNKIVNLSEKAENAMQTRNGQCLIMIFCIFVLSFTASCKDESKKVAEKSKEFATHLSAPPAKSSKIKSSPVPQIYVDSTKSMKGFVGSKNNMFKPFMEGLINELPEGITYKFGSPKDDQKTEDISKLRQKISFNWEMFKPDFYDRYQNPDEVLIQNINPDEFFVYVTDGVCSGIKEGVPSVVPAVYEWIKKGNFFGILMLKSDFSGILYSEIKRSWYKRENNNVRWVPIEEANNPTPINISARPFYAFVFSPTSQEFKKLLKGLQPKFPDMKVISFSDDAVNYEIKDTKEQQYKPEFKTDAPFWQMFGVDIFSGKSPELTYEIAYQFDTTSPIKALELTYEAEYYLWKNQFAKPPSALPNGFKCEIETAKTKQQSQSSLLKLKLVRDQTTHYGFYRIKIKIEGGIVRDDITEAFSTNDDSDLANGGKTYKFSHLISALTKMFIQDRLANKTILEFYLTVAHK